MGLYENMARLKEANLCNIVLVPSRLSASGRNKLHHHHHQKPPPPSLPYTSSTYFLLIFYTTTYNIPYFIYMTM